MIDIPMPLEAAVDLVSAQLPLRGFSRDIWATRYASRHLDTYRHIISTIEAHLTPGSTILDFGAGLCDKSVLAQLRGYRCTACDDFGNPLNGEPGFTNGVMDFARSFQVDVHTAERPFPFVQQSFDMVMLHDVIEHLHDSPRELLNELVELIRPGGFLFITVPSAVNIRKRLRVLVGQTNLPRFDTFFWYPGQWRGHVREYTKDDLRSLGRFLGLDPRELHGCNHMLFVLPGALRPLYRLVTGVFPGWRDSWCYVGQKPAGWKPREMSPAQLESILQHLNR